MDRLDHQNSKLVYWRLLGNNCFKVLETVAIKSRKYIQHRLVYSVRYMYLLRYITRKMAITLVIALKIVVFNLALVLSESDEGIEKLSNKEAYYNLKYTIASIKESCGEVCNLSMKG